MAQTRSASSTQAGRHAASGQEAVIGASTRIRGRVTGEGALVIQGAVEGDIVLRGSLRIDEGGSAVSDVQADDVTIAGALEGDVTASGPVHVLGTSKIRGTLRCGGGASGGITVEDGARISGRIECEFDLPDGLGEPAAGGRSGKR